MKDNTEEKNLETDYFSKTLRIHNFEDKKIFLLNTIRLKNKWPTNQITRI